MLRVLGEVGHAGGTWKKIKERLAEHKKGAWTLTLLSK